MTVRFIDLLCNRNQKGISRISSERNKREKNKIDREDQGHQEGCRPCCLESLIKSRIKSPELSCQEG